MTPSKAFWAGKKVFLTGHTGFKGSWMTVLLGRLGATVWGYSLPEPVSAPNLFDVTGLAHLCRDMRGDIRDLEGLRGAMIAARPDVVIHMAAQPIVRASVREPLSTFEINVMGTAKLLEAARQTPELGAVVIVTSDKCYENKERVWPYREDEAMGGADPYSASKGAAELVTAAYARTYFRGGRPSVVSVRAGNVIGGGDWAADRLIPDLVRAGLAAQTVDIRSPEAVRPWQHVLDPIVGYLLAAERAYSDRACRPLDAWNFGPDPGEEMTVREVVDCFRAVWPVSVDAVFAEPSVPRQGKAEASLLRVDPTKAKVELGWRPKLGNAAAVEATATWYAAFIRGQSASDTLKMTEGQIASLVGV